jgi:hypothetical protein
MKTNAETTREARPFHTSTYAMFLRAEDRRRNVLEIAVYSLLMLSLLIALLPLGQSASALTRNSSRGLFVVATAPQL